MKFEYISLLEVEDRTRHQNPVLRIVSHRLWATLLMAFDTVEEAIEVKEHLEEVLTAPEKGEECPVAE